MTLLAVGYLGVQYMLALGRIAFLPALGVVAVAEIAPARPSGLEGIVDFAAIVLGLQCAAASSVLAIGLAAGAGAAGRPRRRDPTRRRRHAPRRRGLADRGAGAAAGRRRGASRPDGRGRRDRLLPGRSTVVLACAAPVR